VVLIPDFLLLQPLAAALVLVVYTWDQLPLMEAQVVVVAALLAALHTEQVFQGKDTEVEIGMTLPIQRVVAVAAVLAL
jgi:hypothetical protein